MGSDVVYYCESNRVFRDLSDLVSVVLPFIFYKKACIDDVELTPVTIKSRRILQSSEIDVNLEHILNHDKKELYTLSNATRMCNRSTVTAKVLNENPQNILVEANILRQLDHANIIGMVGLCLHNPLCLVLEQCARHSLLDSLRERKHLNSQALLTMCSEVCSGMVYLHSKNYVHGNLSAQNCCASGTAVKISNFQQCFLEQEQLITTNLSPTAVAWAAPEVSKSYMYQSVSVLLIYLLFSVKTIDQLTDMIPCQEYATIIV